IAVEGQAPTRNPAITRATATRVTRNGERPEAAAGGRTAPAARAAPATSSASATGDDRPLTVRSAIAAAATRTAVQRRDDAGPTRCGRPRTPVAASASVSPTVFAKCAARPSSALPTTTPGGGKRPGDRAAMATVG